MAGPDRLVKPVGHCMLYNEHATAATAAGVTYTGVNNLLARCAVVGKGPQHQGSCSTCECKIGV
jgi:hypothetical protein